MRKIATALLMSLFFNLFFVSGADINMVQEIESNDVETINFGVNISNEYFTIEVKDKMVENIIHNGDGDVDFTIQTDWNTAYNFITDYDEMSWLERIKVLIHDMGVPAEYLLNIL